VGPPAPTQCPPAASAYPAVGQVCLEGVPGGGVEVGAGPGVVGVVEVAPSGAAAVPPDSLGQEGAVGVAVTTEVLLEGAGGGGHHAGA